MENTFNQKNIKYCVVILNFIYRLPALVLIMRIRGSTDIFNVIEGNLGVNEFLSRLLEAVELFTTQQKIEIKEEEDRSERERVKLEQDIAFHESLAADKAKDEAKRLKVFSFILIRIVQRINGMN